MSEALTERNVSLQKARGRVYTPLYIVECILDMARYQGENVIKQHAIDNSCGDGAFLCQMTARYCSAALEKGMHTTEIATDLSVYLHGIEIDPTECKACIRNLNNTAKMFGVTSVDWDVRCEDAGNEESFQHKMRFVLGNPPYVRVHNLGSSYSEVKRYAFAKRGMTDLFLVFYEIGIEMLDQDGILGLITPSSFFGSLAGQNLRDYITKEALLTRLVDLKHHNPFHSTTYTTIVILSKRSTGAVDYYEFDDQEKTTCYVDTLLPSDYLIENRFFFSKKERLEQLKEILCFRTESRKFRVKNGFATLADDFFIGDFGFTENTIPVVKASTGQKSRCLFPYAHGRLMSYDEATRTPALKEYYEKNEDKLRKRSLDKGGSWWGFGRSQGIGDVEKNKFAVNALIRDAADLKIVPCEKGVGIYGGLYILTDVTEKELKELLFTSDFSRYVSMLGKYKSGGYYTFSSKELEAYLEYYYYKKKEAAK